MEIALTPIGKIESPVMDLLQQGLYEAYGKDVRVLGKLSVPQAAFDSARGQYSAAAILSRLSAKEESIGFERTLGVFSEDIFAAGMDFVFGMAAVKTAVISLYRLGSGDRKLFERRALTEAVHELGHTYGLRHCADNHCVMFFSNTVADTDKKGSRFCPECARLLKT